MSDLNPSLPHWCRKKGFGVLLNIWAKGFFFKAPSSLPGTTVSSAAQKYIPPGNAASLDSSGNHPSGHGQSSVTGPTQPHQSSPSTGQRLRVSTMDPSKRTKSWILLGVQGARRTLTPAQISVKDQSTDCSVFQDLKECYRTQRGRLRLWFSIWRLEFCQVVKVPQPLRLTTL